MEEQKPDLVQSGENVSKSQAEFPPGMAPKMLKLAKMLNDLEKRLEPLISKAHHEVLNKMPPLERAKMGLMEVYTINSLFWSLMRTSGENVDLTLKEDYKIEMGRLKETQARLAEVEARAHRQRVNVEAASRFIHHGLGINRRRDEAEAAEEVSQDIVHNDVIRKQKKNYKYDAIHPRTVEHQDTVDHTLDIQEQEEELTHASSHIKNKKKRKSIENSIAEPDADGSAEVRHESSGYQGSAEDSFTSCPPKKKKLGKKGVKKAKAIDGGNAVVTAGAKKIKKKKVMQEADAASSPSADVLATNKVKKKKKVSNKTQIEKTESDRNGYGKKDKQDAVAETQKKKKKKKQQGIGKQSDISITSCLDTTGSGIVVEDDLDCSSKGRDWYEQGWT